MDIAKIFKTGRSQAVRLPKKYRFDTAEVEIRKEGNHIILTPITRQGALEAFLAMPCCPDFEVDRPTAQLVQERNPL